MWAGLVLIEFKFIPRQTNKTVLCVFSQRDKPVTSGEIYPVTNSNTIELLVQVILFPVGD